jgi:hypothetical protein
MTPSRIPDLDPDPLVPPEPEPVVSSRGCAWIVGAAGVFWAGVALIVGEWLG